jgi:hypothetical protein
MARREEDLIAAYTNAFCNSIEHIVGAFGAAKYAKINSNDKASAGIASFACDRS